jgi:hypothetical protein
VFEPAVSGQPLILVAKARPQTVEEPLLVTVRITPLGQNERCFVRATGSNEPDDAKAHLYLSALLYTDAGHPADRPVLVRSELKQGALSKVLVEPVP